MSALLVIEATQTGVSTWNRMVRGEGSLRIEVDPSDVRAGHSAIASLAERAHQQLRDAAEHIADGKAKADASGASLQDDISADSARERAESPGLYRGGISD